MYKRIVLKISGEALGGDAEGVRFDTAVLKNIAAQLKTLLENGIQTSLVIGGGNFWRGRDAAPGMDRSKADQIGMLATVMNAIYVADFLRQEGMTAVVQTPFIVGTMTEQFSKESALMHLNAGRILIFAGGLGHPFFSTDTITALRGAELGAEGLFFAKNIDGVYDCDPKTNPNAQKIETIAAQDILGRQLQVIDMAAANLCVEYHLPVVLFGLNEPNGIVRAVRGDKIGTLVTVTP